MTIKTKENEINVIKPIFELFQEYIFLSYIDSIKKIKHLDCL